MLDDYTSPPFNSVICGYLTDAITNEPLEDVLCSFYWYYNGESGKITGMSGSDGFYELNVPESEFCSGFNLDGYFHRTGVVWDFIEENETMWVNASMYPYPPENSVVCGYVTKFWTQKPVNDAYIFIQWSCEHGNFEYVTETNIQGFYKVNIADGGRIDVYASKKNYRTAKDYSNVGENETVWINLSLLPKSRMVTNLFYLQLIERFPLLQKLLFSL
jgi:hypothetical protein